MLQSVLDRAIDDKLPLVSSIVRDDTTLCPQYSVGGYLIGPLLETSPANTIMAPVNPPAGCPVENPSTWAGQRTIANNQIRDTLDVFGISVRPQGQSLEYIPSQFSSLMEWAELRTRAQQEFFGGSDFHANSATFQMMSDATDYLTSVGVGRAGVNRYANPPPEAQTQAVPRTLMHAVSAMFPQGSVIVDEQIHMPRDANAGPAAGQSAVSLDMFNWEVHNNNGVTVTVPRRPPPLVPLAGITHDALYQWTT
jgi:hypothetical protein